MIDDLGGISVVVPMATMVMVMVHEHGDGEGRVKVLLLPQVHDDVTDRH